MIEDTQHNIITYFHLRQSAFSYSITIDKIRDKICSVKPITKGHSERIIANMHNIYKECTEDDWIAARKHLNRI